MGASTRKDLAYQAGHDPVADVLVGDHAHGVGHVAPEAAFLAHGAGDGLALLRGADEADEVLPEGVHHSVEAAQQAGWG